MNSTEAVPRRSPWISVWISPRKTIRDIVDDGSSYGVIPLGAVWGISTVSSVALILSLGGRLRVASVLAICLLLGPPVGIALVYLGGGILALLGRVLGGKSKAPAVRVALAWSMVPLALGLLRWGVMIAIFGESTFELGAIGTALPFPQSAVYAFTNAIGWGLGLWSIGILVVGYAEVNEFSVARGVATLIAGAVLLSFVFGLLIGICLPAALFLILVAWMLISSGLGAS